MGVKTAPIEISEALNQDQQTTLDQENNIETQAFQCVDFLMDTVYEEGMPDEVQKRYDMLKSGALEINGQRITELGIATGHHPVVAEKIDGVYSPADDKVYLRENSTVQVAVHEMLHFLSSDPDSGVSGLVVKEKYGDRKQKGFNEAMTVLLTSIAVKGIDISKLRDAPLQKDLPGKLKTIRAIFELTDLRKNKGLKRMAKSYINHFNNMRMVLFGRTNWRPNALDKRLLTQLPDISQAYFEHDQDKADEGTSKVFGDRVFEEMVEFVEQPSRVDRERTIGYLQRYKPENLPSEIQSQADEFISNIENSQFAYPEELLHTIYIAPGMFDDDPTVTVNLSLEEIMKEYKFDTTQVGIFIIWQSLKYSAAKQGEQLMDKDFYNNPTMISFLTSQADKYGLSYIEKVSTLSSRMFGADIPQDLIDKSVQRI